MESTIEALSNTNRLTLPILRLGDNGESAYVKVISAIFMAALNARGYLEWMDVIDLSGGKAHRMQAYTVLANELRANYPSDGYVGK
ncbi:MAG TPA: hypothetical protein VMV98_08560, partial [Acidobacteriaceae bacterium]|nr:hypothetical protein [Acidobacteriaceae bacterium]